MAPLNADAWLNLGVPGAALFIVAVVVVLMFRQQGKSVDKLCTKIDELVSSFADNNLKLNEVIISNDKDQKEVLREIKDMRNILHDIQRRMTYIEVRLGGEEVSNESSS